MNCYPWVCFRNFHDTNQEMFNLPLFIQAYDLLLSDNSRGSSNYVPNVHGINALSTILWIDFLGRQLIAVGYQYYSLAFKSWNWILKCFWSIPNSYPVLLGSKINSTVH